MINILVSCALFAGVKLAFLWIFQRKYPRALPVVPPRRSEENNRYLVESYDGRPISSSLRSELGVPSSWELRNANGRAYALPHPKQSMGRR
jgi:hypothetical protein